MDGNKNSGLPEPPPPAAGELFTFLKPYLRPHAWRIAGIGALLLFGASFAYLEPLVQRQFINTLTALERPQVWFWGILTVLTGALLRLCAAGESIGENSIGARITMTLKTRLSRRLLDLPVSFFHRHGSGYLAGRLTRDIDEMQFLYSAGMTGILSSALRLLGGLALLFVLDWRVGAVVVLILPLYLLAYRKFRGDHYRVGLAVSEANAANSRTLQSTFSGIRLLKSSAAEEKRGERLGREFEQQMILRIRRFRLGCRFRVLLRAIPGGCRGALLLAGVWMILEGRWTLGGLWALLRALDYVFTPSQLLCGGLIQFHSVSAAAARVMQLDRLLPEENLENGVEPGKLEGRIEFRHVSFGYLPGVPVLRDLSFELRPGEVVALCGPSGGGKSTIAGLLLRFFRPESGEILIDGRPAGEYRLRALRRRIGYIGQTGEFLTGTLAANLLLGVDRPVPETRLREVIGLVGLGARLNAPECDRDAPLEENGVNFSVGERIRLAVAREILRDPDILILDETTASLDGETEEKLMDFLLELLAGRTVLVISHRESTLRRAQRRLELKEGRIYEK
ncbi:MAG: ABC transporter ATP-binding protein [Lentisphaeria bacterium]|nr:ABC transporter ATP-binding protein [Lentisphaeria bacterium]